MKIIGKYILCCFHSIVMACIGINLAVFLWFLCISQTWRGRGIAIIGSLLLFLFVHVVLWYRKPASRSILQKSMFVLSFIVISLGITILISTPTGQPTQPSPIIHAFSTQNRFAPYRIANIIPEIEQINLGFWLMPLLDPYLTWQQTRRVSGITLDIYHEMESDARFRQLGSVMTWAYAELLGKPFDVGHYYRYVPQIVGKKDSPLPAIVFLHGSVGNFKAYMWLWSHFAEKYGFVIIAPSFGFGNWSSHLFGRIRVIQALDHARMHVHIDPNQVYLAGLSNGGLGVCEVARYAPKRFRGLIFLSPVLNRQIATDPLFHKMWKERSMLFITGEKDRRIPLPYIQKYVSLFQDAKIDVTKKFYPNEDHFLFFSQSADILQNIHQWIKKVQTQRLPIADNTNH